MTVSYSVLNLSFNPDKISVKEQSWVSKPASELVQLVSKGEVSSVELVTAFLKQADQAHQQTNCITECFEQQALQRAKQLDDHLATHGTTVGMLHGLPISVKEHIKMKDTISSCGYRLWYGQRDSEDSLIVEQLQNAGAIVICKTTNPQSLMALETHSNVYGRTCNAHNPALTSGGSSGGEGALMALNGSTMGVGTDIGGSIRTPAAHNGVYGLKPSVGRLPHSGLMGNYDGMENIVGVVGPLARFPQDLELFCRAALHGEPWKKEQAILPMPWKSDVKAPEKMCIAIIRDDGLVRPQPSVVRALKIVEDALKNAGHDVIYWDMIDSKSVYEDIWTEYLQDGGKELTDLMPADVDPPVPILQWMFDTFGGKQVSLSDSWKLSARRNETQKKFNERWNSTFSNLTGRNPDAIICPTHPSPAPPHDHSHHWNYTCYWNQMDSTVAVFPVTTVDEALDVGSNEPLTDFRSNTEREYHENYRPETYKNAPVSLQLVGRRLQEEYIMQLLHKIVAIL